ncbi:MAG: hydrogenase maturation nickel metallochaperone HypA [Candidatus Hydromicrobium sp.]|nr:hydrogenase maturation nickel metallochaperone HypA [Candidatus Hydromicrobium sp.]
MHEYSITCSIIKILNDLIRKHKIKKLKKINFEISTLAHIEPQSIEFYYNFLTRNSKVLKDASLEFKKDKIKIECSICGKSFKSENIVSNCIYCSGNKLRIINSDDIKIISIET